ncbi:molybdopterin-dependent oxidoreductase [Rhizobium sp. KVB221]|uniref:Molybdopterin-dependent oxidoreductase n=1 Tax=Rhizobium setariae TaxID=2801340 RepID=A0A937CRS1_9HYPH|nr:molybdopterin cofactor-binding domain-containing protein [Rhizobium setariae]MBL0375142.1 molybdopterin-dependent oxidoreductase [Rhizobium setariae]
MNGLQDLPRSAWLEAPDMLLVIRHGTDNDPEIHLAIDSQGKVTAFCGKVDLGTGIRTALAQIAAEELDVAFDAVTMVLGATSVTPDQGPTIASETIQITARPLRLAAATARHLLLARAAEVLDVPVAGLTVEDGIVHHQDIRAISYGELVRGKHERIEIDLEITLKRVRDYRIVGSSQPRNDMSAKITGQWTFVHDVRIEGMLHGRVVRPPYVGYDHGEMVGRSLISVDESSVADLPGLVGVVVEGDFVGVIALREEQAIEASKRLKVLWRDQPARPDLNRPEEALRGNPSTPRVLADQGDVEAALEGASPEMKRTYVWPYQMHGSIGPSCAVADWSSERLVVWSGTQNPYPMRRDLALLLDMPEERIEVERLEAAGCYGRNCADDVTADAALLSRAVGKPVRVQLTREQEHGWEPKGAAQVIDVRGGLDLEGGPAGYDFETRYPSNLAPTLALILTGKVDGPPLTVEMGDRTAIPPYAFGNMRVTVHDMPPLARASWFRGVSAMPNSFAHESFIDELAFAAGVDPVEYRLRYLTDARAIDLVRAVAEKAKWTPRTKWGTAGREGDLLYGRGFAYALYVHGKFPGTPAAWSAWVADVAVNRKTGEIAVTRITVGQDAGLMINPDGVRHQIHGNVIQSISRVLKEKIDFSDTAVESAEWGGYPILSFEDVPEIDVLMLPRPDEEPRGVGESASIPSAAAIANAVYDATGIRFRELPLTPDRVLAALEGRSYQRALPPPTRARKSRRWWQLGVGVAGVAGIAAGGLAVLSPWRGAYPPIPRPDPAVFSAATIERGRLAAAAGACNLCHVGSDGTAFAGGRGFETPFGTVYASNISPDPQNGIGAWSYPAFERAMRQGISRDGQHLYPVHPYTSFTHAEDADLQALYAFLMNGTSADNRPQETALSFPFNNRALMAGWNTMFLRTTPVPVDATRSTAWNRGAYLVESLGHCSACHTERNALGAELTGKAHLAGGFAEGWEAPAILGQGKAPVSWTEAALYDYLRHGHSADHGSAGGPMAAVVQSMAALPDEDVRAMAIYLSNGKGSEKAVEQQKNAALDAANAAIPNAAKISPEGARLFEGACSSCHGEGTLLPNLALNSNLHSDRPDNLLQVILTGMDAPAQLAAKAMAEEREIMAMPAFAQSFSDRQLADLASYMRARFAPGKETWGGLQDAAAAIRATPSSH